MKTIVIAFGRFNPPTKGHVKLIEAVQDEASRLNAVLCIFPSPTHEPKRNPLPFREKLRYLRMMFPKVDFSKNPNIRNPYDALFVLSKMGFDRVVIVVGADREEEFRRIERFVFKKADKKLKNRIVLQDYRVVTLPRDDMGTMSASLLRAAAGSGDFKTFRAGMASQNEGIAKQLFTSVRRHMGIK